MIVRPFLLCRRTLAIATLLLVSGMPRAHTLDFVENENDGTTTAKASWSASTIIFNAEKLDLFFVIGAPAGTHFVPFATTTVNVFDDAAMKQLSDWLTVQILDQDLRVQFKSGIDGAPFVSPHLGVDVEVRETGLLQDVFNVGLVDALGNGTDGISIRIRSGPPLATVAEPATLGLLAFGAVALASRRRPRCQTRGHARTGLESAA